MPPTKTQVEPQTKAAPATVIAKQPAFPEKKGGPARLARAQPSPPLHLTFALSGPRR